MKHKLTLQQEQILVGLLLGDGNLEFNNHRGARLQVKQQSLRRDYVWWLYEQFESITNIPPQQRKDTEQWYFATRYSETLYEWYELFYRNRRKEIPDSINQLFVSPITLAVWYMDDGKLDYRRGSHYAYSLSTDSFSEGDLYRLQSVLQSQFGIPTTIQKPVSRKKRYPKIYIGKEGRNAFLQTITSYILPCFSDKLPPHIKFDPSETVRRAPPTGG